MPSDNPKLSDAAFGKWLGLLCQHYRLAIDDDLADVYYEEFSHLTDAQFERGARLTMRYESRFPPLEKIIQFAKASGEQRAERKAFEPDTTLYDPTSPEARAARAKCRETIERLKRLRRAATSQSARTRNSGMSSLNELLR